MNDAIKKGDLVEVILLKADCGYWLGPMDSYVKNGLHYIVEKTDAASVRIDEWWFPVESVALVPQANNVQEELEELPAEDFLIEQRRELCNFLGG
jgi:hypothetical protein